MSILEGSGNFGNGIAFSIETVGLLGNDKANTSTNSETTIRGNCQ
jgi:hypothetical protein